LSRVPFLDVGAAYRELQPAIDAAVARVLESGWYIGGPEVEAFETAFADYCEAQHCVGVGNGLDALHLTLRALEVGSGDEVIVASNGFIATLLAIEMAGATPVLVEPDPSTHNLDPSKVEAAITARTRVILPTHLYGQPADIDPLLNIARRHGVKLVEDAAQAQGAAYKGRRIGAHSDAVCWSFYPAKNLGAVGDAGAVTTDDAALAQRVRQLGNYGSKRKYVHEIRGFNSRLDPVQAAILREKLRLLDEWNDRRAAIAALYTDRLAGCGITLPAVPNWAGPAWHLYVVQTPRRDELAAFLEAREIETLIHYPVPPHLQGAYSGSGYAAGDFPIAERLAKEVLSLPIGPHLAIDDAARVADTVAEFGRQAR
jgi:dTDP-4-amino-4,6-dideoxygalactose transaminase